MEKDKTILAITKLLAKCKAAGFTTEKEIMDANASKFYTFCKEQKVTDEEATLFFKLQEALQNKTLFAFLMGESN